MYTMTIIALLNIKSQRPSILEVNVSGPEGIRRLYLDPVALKKISRVRSLFHFNKLNAFLETSSGQNYLEHAYNRD